MTRAPRCSSARPCPTRRVAARWRRSSSGARWPPSTARITACGGHCAPLKADGYAHHPYDFERAPKRSKRGKDDATIGSLRNLTTALSKLSRSGALRGTSRLYLTEYGYLATGRRGLSERKRASYLRQGLRQARHNRHVKEVIQYLLVQPSNGSTFTTGIVAPSGNPLPSFAVLRAAA
ncbi:MAG TPA: hypothetical protein VHR88_10820 [Solirubrobacteraceae bacterium]|jgi:hypothetical protein|nr:hypothetical protein [Solirubrobacteraceae bacterium]